jgi:DNA helicase-2/ATP-dependent DNA helicase PcrA
MEPGQLLEGLDADQIAAVTSPGAPLAIVAPAGSGKTRVLTRRIAWRIETGTADATHVLAITFTRRAAGELLQRLGELGQRDQPTVGTFHGVAWAVLRRRWADQNVRRPPELLAQPERLLAGGSGSSGGRRSATAAELAAEIGWAHARLLSPERYEAAATRAGRRPMGGAAAVAAAYAAYEKAKRAQRLVDFDDLLMLVAREVGRDATFADVQRWRFRHLFVDEFQDVNPLQRALLDAWLGGRPDLCVVGDPNQAIYEWNGADPAWINDFAAHHPGATVVRLSHNYRSTPEILAAATSVLGSAAPTVEAVRPDGARPTVHAFADDVTEAGGVAGLLHAERLPGRRWSAYAVLVRTHAQVPLIERALRDAAIPARVRGGQPLLAHAQVQAVLDAATESGPGSLPKLIDGLDEEVGEGDGPAVLATLAALGRQFAATDPNATVMSFRVWLALGSPGDDGAGAGDAVDIVTFHAAKGLEWPVVVVAGAERGLVPHASASTPAARLEEARLVHVALTRAERRLHVTWARRRGGAVRVLSPLLVSLTAAAEDAVAPPPQRDRRPAPADPALDALRAWRRAAAVASGLPEPAICTDRALAVVARARPVTVEDLAALPEIGPMAARRLGPRMLAALARAEG